YFNETAPLFITLFDALFTNQNLVSVILNYDASSFEIDFDEIISPFTSVLASRNTVVDTVDVIGDVASWITNISQLDGNTGVLIADPINPFYGVFNATEMFSSTNESEDIALQNVSYQLFFTNTVPINYSLRGNLSLYNESSLISYSECDITVSPHLCVLELNETIRNISQFTSSFTLSLMHDNDSVQTSYTTSVPLSTFVSVPTKDSSSALVNLSSSQLGHVSLYANTSLPESFMNVNATHDIILDGSLSVNYTVIPAVQTLSPYFSQHYNVSGHLSVYNESTSTLLADTSCTANTSPFECSVDVIPSGAENVTSSLTISLDRLTPFAINSSIDLDELTSSIDIDAASGLANISELDGNNVTLYTNETVHESSVLVSGTASPELTYPFANFSISVHTIDETPIPENHTLFVTTSIVNATNNAQTFQSESCDFTETSLSPFSCSIVVPWNDSYSRVLTSVNFTRTDGFDEPMQSLAIDFVNKTLIEFDNSTTLFNINHIFVNQTESVSPVSLHLDFVDVQYEYANRSFTGEVTFADENEIHLSLSSINIGENKTFTLPGRVLTDGNLFANVSSIEGGLAEAEGVVTLLIPPTPPSNETTTPGTGGGGGGGAASQPEIEEEEDVDRTMYLISESYTTSLSVNLFNQHLSALKGLNLVSTELYVYDDVKNTSNGRVHQQEGEERDELVRLAESTNFAASAEYYSTLSHVYGCLNYYRRDVREDAGELYITLFGRNFCPDEISFSIFDNSSSFNQFQPTLQNTRTENIQNISYGEGYITGDVHLDAYEDFSLTYVLPLTNTLRNNINSNILLWQINEAFVPYLSYEEFQIELHSEPDNITTIPPVLIPEQESTFAQVTAFIGELTQLNFFEIVIVASLIVVFIIVIIASTFISFREHSSHVSNVIHMALRPRASLKNHEVVTSIGIQSAYLSKLIKEDDLDRAQNEYEKIRVNYVEARKKLNDADPQVHKIMFQVITQLNDYRKHILQRKAELKSAHITSQTQKQSHKQEEDTNPHHEYDMLLRIKAAHIEMTHKNFKAAEEILITSKKLLEKLSDEDLDGQKENFDSRLKLLETTLIKLRSGSLKYRLSQLFKFSKNNASVEKQASNQPTPS
ncbi:MAG: hypothetical protein ACMXYE_05065, partial [Candidatus Woesearchaeota archaeon]